MIRRFALLQTFVAVARAGKMKQAAHELALTPGAVSQRIRQLEEVAGRRLFTRTSTGVELSAAGEAMFVALAEPFQAIEAVDKELGAPSSRRVTVSTTPSFAATWLVPRLAMFGRLYPDIEIAVEAGTHPVDLKREPIDLAIRHGLGKYPGLESTWLVAPELIVVASPDLLKNRAPLARPAEGRPVLDVRRRREKPSDLFRTENNGQAARLTDRHDRVDKIAALQRDLEEEPQRAGTGVDGRYRCSGRPQVQLVAMDILRSGLVERPAHEIREAFNVADILMLSVGAKPTDRHVLDQSPAQRADGLVGHWGLLS